MPPPAAEDDTPPPGGQGWASTAIVFAAALLLLINAQSVRSWTAQLPPGEAALTARDLAERWWSATAQLGLATPRAAITEAWNRLVAARFGPAPEDQR
jgi:hypothetical protein